MNLKDLIQKELVSFTDEQDGFRKFPRAKFAFSRERAEEFSRVSIETILDDKYFLGLKWNGNQGLYPALKDLLLELEEERQKRIINTFVFTGSIGAGKCQKYNSLCVTNKGILTMQEAHDDPEVTHLLSESGMRPIISKISEGEKDGIELTFNNGIISHTTPHHRLRVWTEEGKIEWKFVRDIREGDYVIFTPNINDVWGTRTEIDGYELTEKRCEVLGLWVAEGRKYSTNIIEIISGEKKEELEQLFIDADLSFKHMRIVTNAHHYNLYGDIAQVVIKYFKSGSSNKQIPQFIREMPKHLIVAFLRGMFAGDGSFQVGKWGRGTITYTTVSKELIEQVAIFLTYLGIKFSFCLDNRPNRKEYKTCYSISIRSNKERTKFRDIIGTIFERRVKALESCCYEGIREKSRIDAIPYADKLGVDYFNIPEEYRKHSYVNNGVIRNMFRKIRRDSINRGDLELLMSEPYDILPEILKEIYYNDYWAVPVKKVENKPTVMYDFMVDGDPSYISNGFINHNTTLISILAYIEIFKLIILPNPAKYYELTDGSTLCHIMLSRDADKAKKVTFKKLLPLFANSPFFQDYYPAQADYEKLSENPRTFPSELRFPKNLVVFPGQSGAASALGHNIFSGGIDEANDFEYIEKSKKTVIKTVYDAAAEATNEILGRMDSRFPWERLHRLGKRHGILSLIGQTRGPDSFLERKIREAEALGDSSNTFWVRKARWESQPRERFSKEEFIFDITQGRIVEFISKEERDLSENKCEICNTLLKHGAYIGNNGKLVCSLDCYEETFFGKSEIVKEKSSGLNG